MNRLTACGLAIIAFFAATVAAAASKDEIDASVGTAMKHFNAINPSNRDLEQKAVGI